jgi:hypothetical protein
MFLNNIVCCVDAKFMLMVRNLQREERERVQMQHVQANLDSVRVLVQSIAQNSGGGGASSEEIRLIRERLEQLSLGESGGSASDLIVASKFLQEAADKLVLGESKLEDHATLAKGILDHFRSEVDRLKVRNIFKFK